MSLSMLYDMKPQAVERYLILPYLQDFIRKCDEGKGLWTFLKTIYPDYEIADGEAITEDEFSEPHSNLYAFILTHYDIPLLTVVPDETDGIACKKFFKPGKGRNHADEDPDQILSKLSDGMEVRVRGSIRFDTYMNEYVLFVDSMAKKEKVAYFYATFQKIIFNFL